MTEYREVEVESFAQSHIEACRESLTNPKVVNALGERAVQLVALLDELQLTDYIDGEYTIDTEDLPLDYIPLLISENEEKMGYDEAIFGSMHPRQVQLLQGYLIAEDLGDYTESALSKYVGKIQIDAAQRIRNHEILKTFPNDCAACVDQGVGRLHLSSNERHGPTNLHVSTRPFVVINVETEPSSGEILIHELVHVQQVLRDAIVPDKVTKDDYTSLEMEAYHVEAMACVALGLKTRSNWNYKHARRVEAMRKATRGELEDPFVVTDELRRILKPRGYDFQFCPR